jgi:hypothetical protein
MKLAITASLYALALALLGVIVGIVNHWPPGFVGLCALVACTVPALLFPWGEWRSSARSQ